MNCCRVVILAGLIVSFAISVICLVMFRENLCFCHYGRHIIEDKALFFLAMWWILCHITLRAYFINIEPEFPVFNTVLDLSIIYYLVGVSFGSLWFIEQLNSGIWEMYELLMNFY